MVWLCVMGISYLLYRAGTFWLWQARLTGNKIAERLSYAAFLSIGSLICITTDILFIHDHGLFSNVWYEALVITAPSILVGEFLYLRKMALIIETLACLQARNTRT